MTPALCHALVPAAGVGSRAGQPRPKQYVAVAGRPLMAHTLDALSAVPAIASVNVVVAPDDAWFEAEMPIFAGRLIHRGGASVAAGLAALQKVGAADHDWVLVHDAARCLVRPAWISALIDACRDDAVGGLLAQPVADTLKEAEHQRSLRTADRSRYWQAQTPQMFRLGLLRRALATVGEAVTDEASAIEALGHSPLLVPCSLENFKVTRPEDFDLADRLLRSRP